MTLPFLEQHARLQYRLLGHSGYWTQLHAQDVNNDRLVSRELVYGEEAVIKWGQSFNTQSNLFLGRNPRDKDGKVAGTTCVSFDIDPIRGPKTAAIPEQHQRAIKAGQILSKELCGVLASSGNGALVIVPFGEIVQDDLTAQIKAFEEVCRKQITDPGVRLDATFDAARLVKLMGSVSVKGDPTLWRHAKFLSKPVLSGKQHFVLRRLREWVKSVPRTSTLALKPSGDFASRSEADYALAIKCQLAGLGPSDTLAALSEHSFRPERTDDHSRIVAKVYSNAGTGPNVSGVSRDLPKLWTPTDPISGVGTSSSRGPGGQPGLPTGFKWLDAKLNGGYRGGHLYGVLAPTNTGKTAFIIQTAQHLCERGHKVLLVTTEASIEEVCQRYWAAGTSIPTAAICNGRLSEDEQRKLAAYQESFRTHKLYVHYTVSPGQATIKGFIDEVKPDILLWDYFQHFETGTEGRQTQLGSLARWFESVAIEYQIPVVVAGQLHERFDFKSRTRLPAIKDDIKDCKVLNDAAKTIIVLDWDKKPDTDDGPVSVRMSLDKNKGAQGETKLLLVRRIPRFEEI